MKRLYSVYDVKAEAYGPLMAVKADAVAVREFGNLVLDPQSMVGKYPDDYELHELGGFHDDAVTDDDPRRVFGVGPRVVMTARNFLAAQASGPQGVADVS